MVGQKPLDRAAIARRYTELENIIAVGAYTEDDEDGSLWLDDQNITEEIDELEARAAGEDLKFVATKIDQKGRHIYVLEELTDEEKQEQAAQRDALRQAAIAAAFHWQDQNKIVLDQAGYVMGKVPGQAPAYVVRIDAEIREDDPLMTYSWPANQELTVTWKPDGTPVIDDATEEQVKQIRAAEEALSEAAAAIREWARQSYAPISTADDEMAAMEKAGLIPGMRVDLLRLERKDNLWEALLAIAGGRFNLRVVFWLDDVHTEAENRLHIESQQQEYPEEERKPNPAPGCGTTIDHLYFNLEVKPEEA